MNVDGHVITRLESNDLSLTIDGMDAKKTIKKLKGEVEKSNVTLYLSTSTFAEFKRAVHPIAPSKVLDELIKEFMEDLNRPKPKKASKKN